MHYEVTTRKLITFGFFGGRGSGGGENLWNLPSWQILSMQYIIFIILANFKKERLSPLDVFILWKAAVYI